MSVTRLKEPAACTGRERRAFARLVRHGFPRAQRLGRRVREAGCLAFHYATDGDLVAVAALKAPSARHRREIFRKAVAALRPADYPVELGWVFVLPDHRRMGIAKRLCRRLMRSAPKVGVFATTRPTNRGMKRILASLGFARTGKPYPRRDEEFVVFARPSPHA